MNLMRMMMSEKKKYKRFPDLYFCQLNWERKGCQYVLFNFHISSSKATLFQNICAAQFLSKYRITCQSKCEEFNELPNGKKSVNSYTPACLIQDHGRLFFLKKKSTLCALIRHYSIIMIRPCAFNKI